MITTHTPLTPGETAAAKAAFEYRRVWTCPCGAQLRIRAREARADGPSNFRMGPGGHAVLPSSDLTWNGLAEERGWQTDPVCCPACQRGMSVAAYKDARRSRLL
jgi:hypothetical protein